jgi:hypothetical protein
MTILLSEEDMTKYPGNVSIAISYTSEPGPRSPVPLFF